jgi:hypothetical protein
MSKEWRSSDKDREVREEKIHPWNVPEVQGLQEWSSYEK